jgi:hypothetical protein
MIGLDDKIIMQYITYTLACPSCVHVQLGYSKVHERAQGQKKIIGHEIRYNQKYNTWIEVFTATRFTCAVPSSWLKASCRLRTLSILWYQECDAWTQNKIIIVNANSKLFSYRYCIFIVYSKH